LGVRGHTNPETNTGA